MTLINVNGCSMEIETKTLGYSAIVYLAEKEIIHEPTVTYSCTESARKGSLFAGQYVELQHGMIFNVQNTGGA